MTCVPHIAAERYKFIKCGMQAFNTFKIVPPGIGIVDQADRGATPNRTAENL